MRRQSCMIKWLIFLVSLVICHKVTFVTSIPKRDSSHSDQPLFLERFVPTSLLLSWHLNFAGHIWHWPISWINSLIQSVILRMCCWLGLHAAVLPCLPIASTDRRGNGGRGNDAARTQSNGWREVVRSKQARFSRWDARASHTRPFKEQNHAILGGPNTFTFQVVSDTFQKLLPRYAEWGTFSRSFL